MTKKKKVLSIVALALLIVVAVVANYMLGRQDASVSTAASLTAAPQTTAAPDGNFFATYRQQRQESLSEESAQLEAILSDEKTDEATRQAAQEQLMTLVANRETEQAIEVLLRAKGFEQVAVAIHQDTLNVIVGSQTLTDTQSAQILDICVREANMEAKNIKIIPANVT